MTESDYKNSGGYFAFPDTGEPITADTPRAVTCKPGDKWVQPIVLLNDGTPVRISGRCWNDEERACYKEYRGKPSGPARERKPREPKMTRPSLQQQTEEKTLNDREVVKYNPESVATPETLATLAQCDRCLGVSYIAGISYALVTANNSNVVHHIPRSCIPDEEFDRLMCGDAI